MIGTEVMAWIIAVQAIWLAYWALYCRRQAIKTTQLNEELSDIKRVNAMLDAALKEASLEVGFHGDHIHIWKIENTEFQPVGKDAVVRILH